MRWAPLLKILRGLLTGLAFYTLYSVLVALGANWIFWVYLALCSVSAVVYVAGVRGNLTPMPKEPPPTWPRDTWEEYRERVEETRRRLAFLPVIFVGTAVTLVLDAVWLFLLDGVI
ncbi:MAG: hypothetical protein IJF73_01975 [Clostridia bacterium]|nr:hypothetical protein [Clostridia bacterium]